MNPLCARGVSHDRLVAYAAGDLTGADETDFEEHLFGCEACAHTLEEVFRLGAAIARSFAEGRITAPVTTSVLEQLRHERRQLREYRLQPGDTVPCTAAPDDRFVAVRLAVPRQVLTRLNLDVDFHDLRSGAHQQRHVADVPVDARSGDAILLFPADVIRSYPRSRWTMHARGEAAGDAPIGVYELDHTPWEELPER